MQKQFLSITFIKLFYYSKKVFVYISSRLINNFAENPFPARVYFLTLFTLVFLSISLSSLFSAEVVPWRCSVEKV